MDSINFTEMLPQDLWMPILMYFKCDEIELLCCLNSKLHIYCMKNDVINKRKYLGFPRKTSCVAHDVSHLKDTTLKIIDSNGFTINQLEPIERIDVLNEILETLHNTELIYGDLIYVGGYHPETFIFNGRILLPLDLDRVDFRNPKKMINVLPKEFITPTNHVSMLYWKNDVVHNSIVWLNISELRNQCIDNIDIESDIVSTSFIYDNITYTIYFSSNHQVFYGYDVLRREFIKCLTDNNILPLEYQDHFGLIKDDKVHNNSLFLHLELYTYIIKHFNK